MINCEPDGFAHSHYVTHGPGVCAIAIDVDDAGKTMARAEALKARTFYQPVGPGELEIPAIRGVGGSLLYFLEAAGKNWDTDFEALRSDAGDRSARSPSITSRSRCPMTRCCRGCCSTPAFSICSACRRWRSPIPVGLVQSQALINGNQSLRVILNGSSATRTLSARFIREFFGSGVQHIAFSCTDIFAAVADMRARGADFLKIPDNYYDDIEAKYDLDAATMAALRDNQILYDREGDGEFFQIYTHTFDERFFFEIVRAAQLSGLWRRQCRDPARGADARNRGR